MSLKKVINATGTVLHTNLGRAPLGREHIEEMIPIIESYNTLEFDLDKGERGHRDAHTNDYLSKVTGSENSTIVNNNASAVFLVLNTLAFGKEVIISRSELVEIGGSFRIPDIMASSGAIMVEVGSVNNTRLADYEDAITENTAMILKVHRSNFKICGKFSEVLNSELSRLCKSKEIPLVYDLGSGLLRTPINLNIPDLSTVKEAITDGASLVTFSGDKLLGGPQAGIISGEEKLVKKCVKAPMMRAMRVGKLTIAALTIILKKYIEDKNYSGAVLEIAKTPIEVFSKRAIKLSRAINHQLDSSICKASTIKSRGCIGGGTLPEYFFETKAVGLTLANSSRADKEVVTSKLFHNLLKASTPVVAILREGKIIFDVCTITDRDIPFIIDSLSESLQL